MLRRLPPPAWGQSHAARKLPQACASPGDRLGAAAAGEALVLIPGPAGMAKVLHSCMAPWPNRDAPELSRGRFVSQSVSRSWGCAGLA